jgi:tetratricopeptide (TPR) repeat protein
MSKNYDLGLQALYAGDLVKADDLLTKAIEAEPLNAEAYFYRGKARWQSGSMPAAINDFNKTLELNPQHNQAKVSLEMVKQIMGFRNPDLYNP